VLDAARARRAFRLARHEPHPALKPWIDTYWEVRWDLPEGTRHRQIVIADTAVNVTVEPEAWLYGVPGPAFVREIAGSGRVFGVKFRAGAFASWWDRPLKSIYNKRVPLESVWGDPALVWARAVAAEDLLANRAALADEYLLARNHGPIGEGSRCAVRLFDDESLIRVEDACAALGYDIRGLQRLFSREIGASPKEVLRRYRLLEAAGRLDQEPQLSGAALAARLGYADQAHFIRDFRAVTGVSPEAYRRRGLSGSASNGTSEPQGDS